MACRKYLIALGAAVATTLGSIHPASAQEVTDSVNPYQVGTLAPLDLARQDFSALNPNAAKPVFLQPIPTVFTDAVWTGLGSDSNWNNLLNWSTNVIPDDPTSVARFSGLSSGQVANLNGASIQLSTLNFSDPVYSGVVGGSLSIGNAIFADGANFDLPDKVFATFGIPGVRGGNNIGGAGSLAASIVGSNGLTKFGDSHLQIDSPQFYTGTTTIAEGKIISTVGDSAFGAGNDAITLNGGSIQIATSNWTSTRTINVFDTSSIYWVGTGRSINYNGNITGSGTLILNGNYGTNVGNANIRSNNSFNGVLKIGGGTVTLSENGAFANVSQISNSGTIELNNASSASNVNRLSDLASVNFRGAAMTVRGGSTPYSETIGSAILDGGTTMVTVDAGAGGAQLNLGTVTRNNNAGLFVQGQNLGNAPGANRANVYITNGSSMLVKGLLPFAWVNPNYSATSTPESPDNVLATYGVNGVEPVTTYQSTFTGATAATNVRISSSGTVTLAGSVVVNSLVLAAPLNQVYSTSPPSTGGMTVQGFGPFIQVDSGVILSAYSGYSNNLSTINSLPGNILRCDLVFGTKEAVILTPAAITLSGIISGTGGLTKIGPRTATFSGSNLYTGQTLLTGFTRFVGNVLEAPASGGTPFGKSTSAIILYGGNASPVNNGTLNGTGFAQLGCVSPNGGTTSFDRDLQLRGDTVMLRNFGDGALQWNGEINLADERTTLIFLSAKESGHQIVAGPITGNGQVVIGSTDPDPSAITHVDLMTAQTFVGGLALSGGTIGLGNDRALGSHFEMINDVSTEVFNTVKISGTSMISALDAPRSIENKFIVYANTFGVGGSNPIEIKGSITGRGGDYIANIVNTATTTFSGQLSGGGFVKVGAGTLVLTGPNNNFTGPVNVGSGTASGGMLLIKSNGALGATSGSTSVFDGQSALGLDAGSPSGSLTITGETLYLTGAGIGSLGALRNIAGNNTWNGLVRPAVQYAGAGTATPTIVRQSATIGVDSGTLTINSSILADDPGVQNNVGSTLFMDNLGNFNGIGVRKTGAGTLLVAATLTSNNSSLYNSSVNITGTLEVAQGVMRIKPQPGVPSVHGGKTVVDVGSVKFGGTLLAPVGQLDLTDSAMIVDYTGTTPIDDVRAYLRAGYNLDGWNGNGITSSVVAASPLGVGRMGISYMDAPQRGLTSIYGDPFDTESIILQNAFVGDTNIDGKVDVTDLGQLALAWNQSGTWYNGDFNYDGQVNVRDLYQFALNWQYGVPANSAAPSLDVLLSSFGLPPVTSVPEPSSLVALVGLGLLARRRRHSTPRLTQ